MSYAGGDERKYDFDEYPQEDSLWEAMSDSAADDEADEDWDDEDWDEDDDEGEFEWEDDEPTYSRRKHFDDER